MYILELVKNEGHKDFLKFVADDRDYPNELAVPRAFTFFFLVVSLGSIIHWNKAIQYLIPERLGNIQPATNLQKEIGPAFTYHKYRMVTTIFSPQAKDLNEATIANLSSIFISFLIWFL